MVSAVEKQLVRATFASHGQVIGSRLTDEIPWLLAFQFAPDDNLCKEIMGRADTFVHHLNVCFQPMPLATAGLWVFDVSI